MPGCLDGGEAIASHRPSERKLAPDRRSLRASLWASQPPCGPVLSGVRRSPAASSYAAVISENPSKQATYKAEGAGFEPAVRVNGLRFSRPVHSTTLPPLPAQ